MRKPIRIVIAVLVAIVLLVAIVAVAIRVMLDEDRVKAALEAQATAALGRPVTIGSARPRLFPRVGLELGATTIGEGREVSIDRIRVSTGVGDLLRRRIQDATLLVEGSTIDIRWALALLASMGEKGPDAAASEGWFVVDSINQIATRDVTFTAGPRTLRVEMDAALSGGDRFVIRQLSAQSEGSSLTATGELSSIASRKGAFTIDAASLDLDALMAFLAAATPAGSRELPDAKPAPEASGVPLDVDVAVRAVKGRAVGLPLEQITANAKLRGSDVRLDDLGVRLLGGKFAGSAAFLGGGTSGRYEWRGRFDGLDVSQLVAIAGSPGAITGQLSGTVNLTAAGADADQALRSAKGTADLAVTDGRVPGLEVVRAVILAFGKPSGERPGGSGEAFTRLAATLAIQGLAASATNLTFASRDFDMTGSGRVSLVDHSIDFRTDVMLSRELSAQAGRDLYRLAREGDRIVLPARISGTMSAPTVLVDVQAALGRAIRNKAQDELKNLFNRIIKK